MSLDTLSCSVGGGSSNFTQPEYSTSSQPRAATNIAACETGATDGQPSEREQARPLQENQANDSPINMVGDNLSLQIQVKELQLENQQLKSENSLLSSQQQTLQLEKQQLKSENSLLTSQQQTLQLEKQQLEIQLSTFHRQQYEQQKRLLIQILSTIFPTLGQGLRPSELEGETELLTSGAAPGQLRAMIHRTD
ncbi:uncharacterized protein [Physcomitrium patens]|nr:histone-lysine N-methyltransferase 2D-like [Physcomitrium patens]|eukprot:XP_024386146.1 histone-lysine N-methyltransferase 2D-like [Physcomitrella patens]